MSDYPETAPAAVPAHLAQADEASGRPSEGEVTSAQDRLTENTPPAADAYGTLTLPQALEGHEENFASFKQLAAELNLPADTAQKLVEWEAARAADGRQSTEQARADILRKWTEQTKEMFGPAYPRELARALDAAQRFGGDELRQLLDATGLGSHPAVVRAFHQISQQISEDQSVGGRARTSTDKTFAEALYGKAS